MLTFIVVLAGWIFSLCLHEFSHALVAYYGGDTTVKDKGYLTFNPLKYTHPMLSIVMPLVFLAMGGIGLPGGAVYIEDWRLRSRSWKSAVSLAGPASNLLLAIVLGILLRFDALASSSIGPGLAFLALLQVSALILNLIPVPPLDGFGIIAPYFDPNMRAEMNRFGSYGIIILFLVMWYVPGVNDVFWGFIFSVSRILGIPLALSAVGWNAFTFWR